MSSIKPWCLLIIAWVLLAPASVAATELVDPDPIAIPAGLSSEQVTHDIKRALIGRGWVVTREEDGRIDATLNLRAHVARIAISHGEGQVRIAYVSSENLKFRVKDGRRTIHKNYLSWVNNLVTDISRNLQVSSMS
jgi:hypothetical protein